MHCKGTEKSLQECNHSPKSNCGPHEAAGVICEGMCIGCDIHLDYPNNDGSYTIVTKHKSEKMKMVLTAKAKN